MGALDDGRPAERVVFDLPGLYAALDAERRARALSWQQLAGQLGVAGSTILRTARGGAMEADGVLAMVRWLGATAEAFVRPARVTPAAGVPPGRCDPAAVHRLLDERRRRGGLTWRQVAAAVGDGVAPRMLTRLAGGGRMSIQLLVAVAAWLDCPIDRLTRGAP